MEIKIVLQDYDIAKAFLMARDYYLSHSALRLKKCILRQVAYEMNHDQNVSEYTFEFFVISH